MWCVFKLKSFSPLILVINIGKAYILTSKDVICCTHCSYCRLNNMWISSDSSLEKNSVAAVMHCPAGAEKSLMQDLLPWYLKSVKDFLLHVRVIPSIRDEACLRNYMFIWWVEAFGEAIILSFELNYYNLPAWKTKQSSLENPKPVLLCMSVNVHYFIIVNNISFYWKKKKSVIYVYITAVI